VAKTERVKKRRQLAQVMMPNLSGVSFKDALKALLETPPPKMKKK
jgi:hypothetical protein